MFTWLVLIPLFLYIYQPLVLWNMRGEIPLTAICVVSLAAIWLFSWLFNPTRRLLEGITTSAILMYTLAITISILFSSSASYSGSSFQAWIGHLALFVIFTTSAKTEKDLKILIAGFLVIYFMYMGHTYWDFWSSGLTLTSMYEGRLYGTGDRDPNYLATGIVCTFPLLIPLILLCKKYWHYLFVLAYILLALRIIVLSGSRGGMISLIGLIFLLILFSRYRFRILPVVLIVFPIGWFSMPDTYKDRYRSTWDPTVSRSAESARMGRIRGFYEGLALLQLNPLFGVGAGAGAAEVGTVTLGSRHGAHNLPGQIAGELGTLGIVTFMFLVTCFGINHYNIWKNYKYLQEKKLGKEGLYCWRVSLAAMYGVTMLLFQGLSLNNAFAFFWIWFAAFHALATIFIQEKVTAAMQGKLLPSPPGMPGKTHSR